MQIIVYFQGADGSDVVIKSILSEVDSAIMSQLHVLLAYTCQYICSFICFTTFIFIIFHILKVIVVCSIYVILMKFFILLWAEVKILLLGVPPPTCYIFCLGWKIRNTCKVTSVLLKLFLLLICFQDTSNCASEFAARRANSYGTILRWFSNQVIWNVFTRNLLSMQSNQYYSPPLLIIKDAGEVIIIILINIIQTPNDSIKKINYGLRWNYFYIIIGLSIEINCNRLNILSNLKAIQILCSYPRDFSVLQFWQFNVWHVWYS